MDQELLECLLDTCAAITVIRRNLLPSKPAPISKMKILGIFPGVDNKLYGPKMVTLRINDTDYQYPVYEADIKDNA